MSKGFTEDCLSRMYRGREEQSPKLIAKREIDGPKWENKPPLFHREKPKEGSEEWVIRKKAEKDARIAKLLRMRQEKERKAVAVLVALQADGVRQRQALKDKRRRERILRAREMNELEKKLKAMHLFDAKEASLADPARTQSASPHPPKS